MRDCIALSMLLHNCLLQMNETYLEQKSRLVSMEYSLVTNCRCQSHIRLIDEVNWLGQIKDWWGWIPFSGWHESWVPIRWVRDPLEYIINHILNFTVGLTPIWVEIWGASHLMERHSQTARIFNRWEKPIVKHHFLLSSLTGAWMIHPDLHIYISA